MNINKFVESMNKNHEIEKLVNVLNKVIEHKVEQEVNYKVIIAEYVSDKRIQMNELRDYHKLLLFEDNYYVEPSFENNKHCLRIVRFIKDRISEKQLYKNLVYGIVTSRKLNRLNKSKNFEPLKESEIEFQVYNNRRLVKENMESLLNIIKIDSEILHDYDYVETYKGLVELYNVIKKDKESIEIYNKNKCENYMKKFIGTYYENSYIIPLLLDNLDINYIIMRNTHTSYVNDLSELVNIMINKNCTEKVLNPEQYMVEYSNVEFFNEEFKSSVSDKVSTPLEELYVETIISDKKIFYKLPTGKRMDLENLLKLLSVNYEG